MLTTELTSRAIRDGLKELGYQCDLDILWDVETAKKQVEPGSPGDVAIKQGVILELASCEVIDAGMVWSVDGVETLISGHPEEARLRENLRVQVAIKRSFTEEQLEWELPLLQRNLVGQMTKSEVLAVNDDGSAVVLFWKDYPMIEGDTVEISDVEVWFNSFKQSILTAFETVGLTS